LRCGYFLIKPQAVKSDKKGSDKMLGDIKQMNLNENLERLAVSISMLGRGEVENKIKNFQGNFKLDFSEEYLKNLTVDRLRHILFAAMAANLRNKSN
jgi:hypothetical protein